MTDVADGFDGQIEIVRRTRGYRRWPDDVKACIVAESFQPGVRVADVARRHGLAPTGRPTAWCAGGVSTSSWRSRSGSVWTFMSGMSEHS